MMGICVEVAIDVDHLGEDSVFPISLFFFVGNLDDDFIRFRFRFMWGGVMLVIGETILAKMEWEWEWNGPPTRTLK